MVKPLFRFSKHVLYEQSRIQEKNELGEVFSRYEAGDASPSSFLQIVPANEKHEAKPGDGYLLPSKKQ